MNKSLFTGRLTKDIEIKLLDNEKRTKVAYYTIAVQDDYDYQKAHFINCQTYGKAADYLEKYGKKGMYIEFEGKTSTYKKGDQFNTAFVSNNVKLIFSNSKSEDQENNNNNNNDDENIDRPLF